MANIDYAQQIRDFYAKQLSDRIAASNASAAAAKKPYEYNISQADRMYQPKMDEAYTTDAKYRKILRERMANMGYGAGGGTSQTKTADLSNSLLRGLNGIGLEKQGYIDEQKNAMSQLGAQNQASIADITAQNRMDMNTALTENRKWLANMYLSMYLNKNIKKKEYDRLMKALG